MPPYPSVHDIENIFYYRLSPNTLDKFESYLSPDVNVTIAGQVHDQADKNLTKSSFIKEIQRTLDPINWDKRVDRAIVKVVGGGDSPWATVECRLSGQTKTDRKYHHEWVYVIRFNDDGKVVTIRTYIDSAHITHHIAVNEKLVEETPEGTLNLSKTALGTQK